MLADTAEEMPGGKMTKRDSLSELPQQLSSRLSGIARTTSSARRTIETKLVKEAKRISSDAAQMAKGKAFIEIKNATDMGSWSEMRFLLFAIFVTLCLMGCSFLVATAIWPKCSPGSPCKYKKTQPALLRDMVTRHVPPLREWSSSIPASDWSEYGSKTAPSTDQPARNCTAQWFERLENALGGLERFETDPAVVRELLGYLSLENAPFARAAVGSLWNEPVNFETMTRKVAQCAHENRPLNMVLCGFLDDPSASPNLNPTPPSGSNRKGLEFAIHEMMLLEAFAQQSAGPEGREFRAALANHFATQSYSVESAIVELGKRADTDDEATERLVEKWHALPLDENSELGSMELQSGSPAKHAQALQKLFAINLIEATDADRKLGVDSNARLGLALATSAASSVPYVTNDASNQLIYPLEKGWYDAYIAWNLNYMLTPNPSLNAPPKLLIPSILCTSNHDVRKFWGASRIATLRTSFVLSIFQKPERRAEQQVVSWNLAQRNTAAAVSAHNVDVTAVPKPRECCGHGTAFKLWKTLDPYDPAFHGVTTSFSNSGFFVYYVFIVWVAVVLAGLGSEVVIGRTMSAWFARRENGFVYWHYAQLLFAVMLCTAFTASDGIGLPFLAAGLWKFGFPETVNALRQFTRMLYRRKAKNQEGSQWRSRAERSCRAAGFLFDGVGNLLHHFSTAATLTSLMLHLFPRDRALVAGCVVPIVQHIFHLVKYHNIRLFIFLQLGLEVWFQIEVYANIGQFKTYFGWYIDNIGRSLALSMLVAHYFYLAAAAFGMIADALAKGKKSDEGNGSRRPKLERSGTISRFAGVDEADDEPPSRKKRLGWQDAMMRMGSLKHVPGPVSVMFLRSIYPKMLFLADLARNCSIPP